MRAKGKSISLVKNRFEVVIGYRGKTIKHICVAEDEVLAAERIMRIYAKYDPQLKRVHCLGTLSRSRI